MIGSKANFFLDKLASKEYTSKVFPYLNACATLNYNLRTYSQISFAYDRNVNIPNLEQLQDYVTVISPINVIKGNPRLAPEVNNTMNFSIRIANSSNSRSLNYSAEYILVKNKITNSITILQQDSVISDNLLLPTGGQISDFLNIGNEEAFKNTIDWNLPIVKDAWLLEMELSNAHIKHPILLNGIERNNSINSTSFRFTLGNKQINSSSLSYQFNINKSSYYNSYREQTPKIFNHFLRVNLNYSLDFNNRLATRIEYRQINGGGIERENTSFLLWNMELESSPMKNLTISVVAFDLLNNYRNEQRIFTEFYNQVQRSNFVGKYIMLNIKYSFRKFANSKN